MQTNHQEQPRIKILPDFSVNEKFRLRDAYIEEVVETVRVLLPK